MKRTMTLLLLVGCGGGMQPGGSECTKDTDCKGTRICQSGACVEPGGGTGGGQQSGTGGGQQSGTGGGQQSGTGGGSSGPQSCFGGRDSDCPAGYWCSQRQCVATTKSKVGEQCEQNSDCAGNACLFRSGSMDVVGYCSKVCQSFGECPAFWDCSAIANGAATYCVQSN
jgi:hypothetical protein